MCLPSLPVFTSLLRITLHLFSLIKDFLSNRKQSVVLNGKCSSWMDVQARVPQDSILGPLLFLIYINGLPDNLVSKLFADDTSLFSTVTDANVTANQINNELHNISTLADQWKMNFNPNTSKQVKVTTHPQLVFNNNPVHETATQKHLGMFLGFKLNFREHFENMLSKVNKAIRLLRKLQNTLSRTSVLAICKSFISPHLDYCDITYDQAYNVSFQQKVESIQYNTAVAITGAIRGTSKEKLFEELGLESLQHRRWYRKIC